MTGWIILFGGMALFATIIVAMDWIGRRQRRKTANDAVTGRGSSTH